MNPAADELRAMAADLIPEARSEAAAHSFHAKTAEITDVALLQELVDQFSPYASVCVPLLERLLDLQGETAELHARIGQIHFTNGDDEAARESLTLAKILKPESPAALMLEAMLTPDEKRQKEIYARVLQIDPSNRHAWDSLIRFR